MRSTGFFRPELDALRFIAFLCVFAHHALWRLGSPSSARLGHLQQVGQDAGAFGMCLFFLLSAYLITELLRREHEATGQIDLGAFYCRRILRIWPLYFGFLIPCWLVGRWFFHDEQPLEPGRMAAFLLLAGNWYAARHGWTANPAAPLWSISLEEQFYLFWPPVFRRLGPPGVRLVAWLLIPVSMVTIVAVARWSHHADPGVWANTLVQFQFFAIGALLALGLQGRAWPLSGPARLGLVGLVLVAWYAAAGPCAVFAPSSAHPWRLLLGYECAALGTLALFASMLGLPAARIPRWAVYLGKISYGLYVFHFFFLGAARHLQAGLAAHHLAPSALPGLQRVALGFALTVAASAFSYRFFEAPFLRLKERFAVIRSRPV